MPLCGSLRLVHLDCVQEVGMNELQPYHGGGQYFFFLSSAVSSRIACSVTLIIAAATAVVALIVGEGGGAVVVAVLIAVATAGELNISYTSCRRFRDNDSVGNC